MIVMTSLFRLRLAVNAASIMAVILKMISLDVFKSDEYIKDMFNFRETKSFLTEYDEDGEAVSTFAEAGYDSSNYF